MRFSVQPFPYGGSEGELVIRLEEINGADPDDLLGHLSSVFRHSPISEVWVDVAEIAGAGLGHRVALAIRRQWNIVATGPASAPAWPLASAPARLVVDVSGYLAEAVADREAWAEQISRVLWKNPPPAEIFAVAPAPEMLDPAILRQLDLLAQAEEVATLYVGPKDFERAVLASARADRPWLVRRLGALPVRSEALSPPAPAASPGG